MYNQIFELEADLLKALGHSRRLEIIQLLGDQELPVSDIYKMLDLPQANISQHLTILRHAGVVTTKRSGKQIYYSLTSDKIIRANNLLRNIAINMSGESGLTTIPTDDMKSLVPLSHDPVCGMRVPSQNALFTFQFHDQTYYFCASGCLRKFKEKPSKYLDS